MFDVDNQLKDIGYGVQHSDFSEGTDSAMPASILRMGVSADRDPRLAASQRVIALSNRSTVEPTQLDLTFVSFHEHLRVEMQDHFGDG